MQSKQRARRGYTVAELVEVWDRWLEDYLTVGPNGEPSKSRKT